MCTFIILNTFQIYTCINSIWTYNILDINTCNLYVTLRILMCTHSICKENAVSVRNITTQNRFEIVILIRIVGSGKSLSSASESLKWACATKKNWPLNSLYFPSWYVSGKGKVRESTALAPMHQHQRTSCPEHAVCSRQ